jgi:hypothetical protein
MNCNPFPDRNQEDRQNVINLRTNNDIIEKQINNDNDEIVNYLNLNESFDIEYIKNFMLNEYVKKTILTLLVKYSSPTGSKNINIINIYL